MEVWLIFLYILAGLGAGLGTGFAGMSAAVVIAPVLIVFTGMDSYTAIGIALASDVLASAVSAFTYSRNKNIDIKNSLPLLIPVLIFTLLGSIFSKGVNLGIFSLFMTLVLGLKFILFPVANTIDGMDGQNPKIRFIKSIITGCIIGFVCGFIGAGGGILMLIILTSVLGYELKFAVGTSVFIMTFTALIGASAHFIIDGMPDITALIVCSVSTLVFARVGSYIANKVSNKILNRFMGALLVVLAVIMIVFDIVVNRI